MSTKSDILDTENSSPSSSSRLGRSTLHARNEQAEGGGLDRFGRGGPALGDGVGDDGSGSLSDTQHTAISCLLECSSMQSAADKCGINLRTLQNWLQLPIFIQEFNRTRRQHFDQVSAHLQSAANDAAETLMRLLKCGDPLIELRAAKIILQTSQKALENTEIEAAADNLKETVAQQTEQIEKLEAENKSLLDYRDQFRKIVNTLVDGSFRRPDWITLRSWEKITRANESTLAAT